MRKVMRAAFAILTVVCVATFVLAQGPGRGQGRGKVFA